MPKIKGTLLFIPSITMILLEFKYLIYDHIGNEESITLTNAQYWALAIPVFLTVFIFSMLTMWVGYTMIVTKEPVRMTYDSAYEEAAGEISSKEDDINENKPQ